MWGAAKVSSPILKSCGLKLFPKFYFGRGRAGLGSERWGTVRRPSPVCARSAGV